MSRIRARSQRRSCQTPSRKSGANERRTAFQSLRRHKSRRGYSEARRDLAEPAPCRFLERDSRVAAAFLCAVLDLACIRAFVEAVRGWRAREMAHDSVQLHRQAGG